jgi:glycosyltransferase involved in cell wall biosynthesis
MVDITVAICCYKQEKWLHRCLRSLASQTIDKNKFEVIVVNDNPDQSIQNIINNFKDLINIKLINNDKNLGLPASLNVALGKTLGKYFVRVDSDDYVSEHFLYLLSAFLKTSLDYQAVFCDYNKVDDAGRRIEVCDASVDPIACGVMFNYEALCSIDFYNINFKMREGHEIIKRFKEKFKLFHLPVSIYRYRIHDKNRTKNLEEVKKFDTMLNTQVNLPKK